MPPIGTMGIRGEGDGDKEKPNLFTVLFVPDKKTDKWICGICNKPYGKCKCYDNEGSETGNDGYSWS